MVLRISPVKSLILVAFVLSVFGILSNYSDYYTLKNYSVHREKDEHFRKHNNSQLKDTPASNKGKEEEQNKVETLMKKELLDENSLLFHPFDNACQFPIVNIYAEDIKVWRYSERLRTMKCTADKPLASQDIEGYLYIHPHLANYPNKTEDNECYIDIIEGGLRDPITNKGKNDYRVVKSFNAAPNKRILVNANAFVVRCRNKTSNEMVWRKPFPGIYSDEFQKNTIREVSDLYSYDNYAVESRVSLYKKKTVQPLRYSVDGLGFDSTSRSMFYRQLPRTVETMKRIGYHVLYGYTKVGDNSMVNLAPIFVGDVPEALAENKLDASGDINAEWILPTKKKLDPTNLRFLWQHMKEKYGCKTMFNEDISTNFFGLFTYPREEFLPGFIRAPADHYFRAYYLAVYENWRYGPCRNGEQVQKEFVDLWQRFAHQHKDICHFAFTFITTLTHEDGMLLELLDEHISARLERLHDTGALDNTLSLILGDHGNRIGLVQYSYTGRIEERMPLMAIRLPSSFRRRFPEQYANFLANKYKLTSNFDIHQTLTDIVEMNFEIGRTRNGRGISLFDKISANRTCFEASIPENFCTCQQNVKNVTNPVNKLRMKPAVHIRANALASAKQWILEKKLTNCMDPGKLKIHNEYDTLAINKFARHGLRNKANLTRNAEIMSMPDKYDFLNHHVHITGLIENRYKTELLFRIDNYLHTDDFRVAFEPAVEHYEGPAHCSDKRSLIDLCSCLFKYDSSGNTVSPYPNI
ncbi:unnamed protein product [Auanema sp. JU1783]|nr:unnamed protein product [Auanema sp. JU1783]